VAASSAAWGWLDVWAFTIPKAFGLEAATRALTWNAKNSTIMGVMRQQPIQITTRTFLFTGSHKSSIIELPREKPEENERRLTSGKTRRHAGAERWQD